MLISCAALAQSTVTTDTVKQADERIFMVVDHQAEFKKGMHGIARFIEKNLKRPPSAKGIYGQVFISFVVEKMVPSLSFN
jgi:hypothetical protein